MWEHGPTPLQAHGTPPRRATARPAGPASRRSSTAICVLALAAAMCWGVWSWAHRQPRHCRARTCAAPEGDQDAPLSRSALRQNRPVRFELEGRRWEIAVQALAPRGDLRHASHKVCVPAARLRRALRPVRRHLATQPGPARHQTGLSRLRPQQRTRARARGAGDAPALGPRSSRRRARGPDRGVSADAGGRHCSGDHED
jgi:hypothetical protein